MRGCTWTTQWNKEAMSEDQDSKCYQVEPVFIEWLFIAETWVPFWISWIHSSGHPSLEKRGKRPRSDHGLGELSLFWVKRTMAALNSVVSRSWMGNESNGKFLFGMTWIGYLSNVLVTFPRLCDKNLWQIILGNGGFVLAHGLKGYSPLWGRIVPTRVQYIWTHVSAVRKQRDEHWCLAHFLLFIYSRTQARGVVVFTFKTGLPSSVKPF